jgi:hypothetical protein
MSVGGDYGAIRLDGKIYARGIQGYFIIQLKMGFSTEKNIQKLKKEYKPWYDDDFEKVKKPWKI